MPWLGGGTGGVSGPAVRAVALAQVAEVRARVAVPIVGMGGVQTGRQARDMLEAGADVVAVGTESFRDPMAGREGRRRTGGIPCKQRDRAALADARAREPIAHNA